MLPIKVYCCHIIIFYDLPIFFRFYWQSSACVYDIMKDNPVLQGQCSYDEITGVLQKYEAQIYRVHPMNVNSSVCFGNYTLFYDNQLAKGHHSRWQPLVKLEIFLIDCCCFMISKIELKFKLQKNDKE